MSHLPFARLRRRPPLLRGRGRVHPPRGAAHAPRAMQWAVINGRKRLLVGGKINRFIPNPTFDPVARPGILDEYFRGRNPQGKDIRDAVRPARSRSTPRIATATRASRSSTRRVSRACFLFPTLGVGMEESLKHDPEAAVAAFEGFNRWLAEDWGFAYRDRIFAAPYISLIDVDAAVRRARLRARERRAPDLHARRRRCTTRDGLLAGGRRFDPFWARVNESGITVAYHSGDTGYNEFARRPGAGRRVPGLRVPPPAQSASRFEPDAGHAGGADLPRPVRSLPEPAHRDDRVGQRVGRARC